MRVSVRARVRCPSRPLQLLRRRVLPCARRRERTAAAAHVHRRAEVAEERVAALVEHEVEGSAFRRDAGPAEASHQTLSYMGVPIEGERIVFVLDASGSMNAPLAERTRETRGSRAVSELAELLPRLPRSASFDILFFESKIEGFSGGRLVPCEEKRIAAADAWLGERAFDGGTNLYGGLEEAFARKGVEEVILLTDGMPSVGEVQDPHRILAWVQRWNRWRKVRVSTIGLSAPRQADRFLSKLAEQNGGVYRAIR